MNKRLLTAALVGSFGGFVFGYDLGALSASTQSLRGQLQLTPVVYGLTVASSLWGTVCGALLSGRMADRVGRLDLIARCSILYVLAAIGIAVSPPSAWVLIPAMRFLAGMSIGGFTVACPLYLSEIAPIALRGRLVSLFQVQVGAGVLVAFSIGLVVTHSAPTGAEWRWCMGLGAVPALLLVILLQFNAKSSALTPGDSQDKPPLTIASSAPDRVYGREKLFCRKNTRPILLATSIAIFNQLSGVNILLLYLLDILSSAGLGLFLEHTYTVLISSISLATTVLGMAFVDRSGRKPLLLWGSAGMAVCLLLLGLAIPHHIGPLFYLSILVAYNVFFAFSQGTVVWVYLSELFPLGARGAGQGYGSAVNWVANAILVSIFPIMQQASPVRAFFFFSLAMVLQIAVVFLWYPETRGTALGSVAARKSRWELALLSLLNRLAEKWL